MKGSLSKGTNCTLTSLFWVTVLWIPSIKAEITVIPCAPMMPPHPSNFHSAFYSNWTPMGCFGSGIIEGRNNSMGFVDKKPYSVGMKFGMPHRIMPDPQPVWQVDVWHGWIDAPFLRSKWHSFSQTGVLGETYLVGGYPAALGFRIGRKGRSFSYGLQLGFRKHFTQHYLVALLLEEKHHSNLSVTAWVERNYYQSMRWTIGGQTGLGMQIQGTHVRAGHAMGTNEKNIRLSIQITPILFRLYWGRWGGFMGLGYGSAGILQTGLSHSLGCRRTFSP